MKNFSSSLCRLLLPFSLLTLTSFASADVIDAPHNETNNIKCGDCHSYSFWWNYSPVGSDTVEHKVRKDAVCLKCHGEDGPEIAVLNHSSDSLDNLHRDNLIEFRRLCVDCHDPHYQAQLNWHQVVPDYEMFLVSGDLVANSLLVTGAGNTLSPHQSTFQYSNITINAAGWDNSTSSWAEKTGKPERGLIMVLSAADLRTSLEIIAVNESESKITVNGQIPSSYNESGVTFGLIYGQLIRDQIRVGADFQDVKFFNPKGGFVDTDDSDGLQGVCQVCHTETWHFRNSGEINVDADNDGQIEGYDHSSQVSANCIQCHAHSNGFAHGGGSMVGTSCGTATACHGTRQSHVTHLSASGQVRLTECSVCHDTTNFPSFKDGQSLAGTTTCDNCHSADGAVSAKKYWDTPGASENLPGSWSAIAGQSSFCGSCHDASPGNTQSDGGGELAFNVMGDQSSYGFDVTGHGKKDGYYNTMYYQNSGEVGNPAAAQACDACHDLTSSHFNNSGKRLRSGFADDQNNSNCNQCHPPGNIAVSEPILYEGLTEFKAGAHANKLCSDCHDVHGRAGSSPAMSKGGKRDLCLGCHYPENPEGLPVPGSTVKGHDADSTAACSKCHNPHSPKHGKKATGEGCGQCHGHDNGYEYSHGKFSQGKGSSQSHSTHTELDGDDLKGPGIDCADCHDLNNFPYFKSGTDANDDGLFSLAETDVCDTCHSRDGVIDGVNDPLLGAKNNWPSGVYQNSILREGLDRWCIACHDDEPANSQVDGSGVSARNVNGDNLTYGFYSSGHGVNENIGCTVCHDTNRRHIDHTYYPVDDLIGAIPNPTDYRFYDNASVKLPLGDYTAANYALCFNCHDESLISTELPEGGNTGTNFRRQNEPNYEVNLHKYHVVDTKYNCLTCHNVHGSMRTRMTDPDGNGDFRPLRYDNAIDRYVELTDLSLQNDPAHNKGGSIVSNPACGGCHNRVDPNVLAAGLGPDENVSGFGDGWYLRDFVPHSYQANLDFDNDGLLQPLDNCPTVANSSQTDRDNDGVGDSCDNCPDTTNQAQVDTDNDGVGDSCDSSCNGMILAWGTQFGPADTEATGLAVDGNGTSFVVGFTSSTTESIEPGYQRLGSSDMYIARYDDKGNRIWIEQFGSDANDLANAVAIDADNNAYVVGSTSGWLAEPGNIIPLRNDPDDNSLPQHNNTDAFLVKYDANGIRLWVRQLNSPYSDIAHAVALDAAGNVYVTGTTFGDLDGDGSEGHQGVEDIFVTSFDSDGEQRWFRQLGTNYRDQGFAIAVDPASDGTESTILVTGQTYGNLDGNNQDTNILFPDFFVARYSADGEQLGLRQYASSGAVTINSMAMSNAGEIFVVGQDYNTGLTTDMLIHKLDINGDIEWTNHFGSPVNNYGRAVAVDSLGRSYLVGQFNSDIGLRQFDKDGNLLFSGQWGTWNKGGNQKFGAIALDNQGRVYMAGTTSGQIFDVSEGNDDEALLFRLDQSCPQDDSDGDGVPNLWDNCPNTFNFSQDDEDNDGIGNVCDACPADNANDLDFDGLCDSSDPCLNDPINDYAGDYDGAVQEGDGICASVDNCPLQDNSDQQDTDNDGWGDACDNSHLIANPDQKDSDFDGIGDVRDVCPEDPDNDQDGDGICAGTRYLYGEMNGANDNCPEVANPEQLNYDLDNLGDACEQACSDYTATWKSQFGTTIRDVIQAVATVENNGTVVVGKTNGKLNSSGFDFHLTRVAADSTRLWTQKLGSADHEVYPYAVAVAADGSIYVGGETKGDIDANDDQSYVAAKDGYLAKFDSTGTLLWLRQIGTDTDDSVSGLAIDSAGGIYLSGTTRGDLDGESGPQQHFGNLDLFLVKYQPNGDRSWLRQHGTTGFEGASGIAIHESSIYLSGYTSGSGLDGQAAFGYDDAFLLKYNSAGDHKWTQQLGTDRSEKATVVSTDIFGNIYLGGHTSGSFYANNGVNNDIFLVKFKADGTQDWGHQIGGNSNEYVSGIVTTDSGVYLTGHTNGDFDNEGPLIQHGNANNNAILVKFDHQGQHQWSNQFGLDEVAWSKSLTINDIAGSADGKLYLAGSAYGNFTNEEIGFDDNILMQIEECH